MFHGTSPASPSAPPRCLDCGGADRHHDTCPARHDLADLLDTDLARLAARVGRPFERAIHRVERAALDAAGHPVPRRQRGRWSVTVEQLGAGDGVLRTIRDGAHVVAQIEDTPVGGAL